MEKVKYRFATEADAKLILQFVRELTKIAVERGCGRLELCSPVFLRENTCSVLHR